jgi:hypothetical protein
MGIVEIEQVGPEALAQYAQVPTAFEVRSRLRVVPVDHGLGGLAMREELLAALYVKDYEVMLLWYLHLA